MQFLADHSDIVTVADVLLRPNGARAIMRPFVPGDPEQYANPDRSRPQRIVDRVLALTDDEVRAILDRLIGAMADRPRDADEGLLRHFDQLSGSSINTGDVSKERKLLIAAYLCAEYTFEAAALFNPSMIPHPESSSLPGGGVRFLLSLRAVGEGHVSSVTFRTGSWSPQQGFKIDDPTAHGVMLQAARTEGEGEDEITFLARERDGDISEMVLFPMRPSQRQGIEDMRLVMFEEPGSEPEIFGTYTAFDGHSARPEMIRVSGDPRTVSLRPLKGRYSTGKGMALFPRKIGGRYWMLSRQDNENIWLLWSDDPYEWNEGQKLLEPVQPWEFIQLGNCGSPIEIDEGWLVLTHGVGVVRSYAIGVCLLDKDDPSKVIGRLAAPLVRPGPVGRAGYVPNVVYSCGGMVHDRTLLLPYAIADSFTGFASVPVDALLERMRMGEASPTARLPELETS
jgi:predicted GH43/DUF377 family glycosyl hydrolase